MSVEAYVFITTTNPRPARGVSGHQTPARRGSCRRAVRHPDVVAIVTGDDLAGMDAVIDRIVEPPEVRAGRRRCSRT